MALPVAEFLMLLMVTLVSTNTIWLFVNTSSEAVGIILPLQINGSLQLPEFMGHLFGICYFPLYAAITAAVVCVVDIFCKRAPIVLEPVNADTA